MGRATYEILRPVPIAPLRVEAAVVRPGRSVEMVEATLSSDDGELIRATAWRLRTSNVEFADPDGRRAPPPGPEQGEAGQFFRTGHDFGYHTAMEYRFVRGDFMEAGPATVWMRPRLALVDGEQVTPLQRVLVAGDSGNGVSAALDWQRYLFINVDLSVHLHPAAGRRLGLPRRRHPPGAKRRRHRRHRPLRRARSDRARHPDPAGRRAPVLTMAVLRSKRRGRDLHARTGQTRSKPALHASLKS